MAKPARSAKQSLLILNRVYRDGKSVVLVGREAGVSRKTFYQWAKRYTSSASRNTNLVDLKNKKRVVKKFPGQAPIYLVDEVKKIAFQDPQLSKYKIAQVLRRKSVQKKIGVHGVYNILKRSGLATPEARRQWRDFVLGRTKRTLTLEQR